MTHTYVNCCRRCLMLAVILAPRTTGWAQTELTNHQVFAKYSSLEQVRHAVDEFRRDHPDGFATAFHDFELAVRATLDLVIPDVTGRPGPIVVRRWTLDFPNVRSEYEGWIVQYRDTPGGVARAEFFERHLDELSIDLSPGLRYALVDVLLNRLDDWSQWQSERLREYRARYPDVYRVAAANMLMRLDNYESQERAQHGEPAPSETTLDVGGVFLRMLVQPALSDELRKQVAFNVQRIANDIDALDFVVKAYLATEDPKIRYQCLAVWGSLSQSLSNDDRLTFWLPYLETPDTRLRAAAIGGVGNSRRRPRDVPLAEHPDREIVERLRRIAEQDPDKQVRQHALNAIKSFEDDSPPRELTTYDKGGE